MVGMPPHQSHPNNRFNNGERRGKSKVRHKREPETRRNPLAKEFRDLLRLW